MTIAGLPDSSVVKCSRGVQIKPDVGLAEVKSKDPYDIIVLPGGLGGAKAFAESKIVGELLQEQERSGRLIAAICAGEFIIYDATEEDFLKQCVPIMVSINEYLELFLK